MRDTWTCPHCNQTTPATAQRTIRRPGETIRYRKCDRCQRNFKTVERLYTENPRATAIASLIDLGTAPDRALFVVEQATPSVVLRYVDALPAFQRDRARRGDPIRKPAGFICWAILNTEPIPTMPDGDEPTTVLNVPYDEPEPEPDPDADGIWNLALAELEMQMSQATFNRWLRGSKQLERENGHLRVGVRDDFAVDWCTNRLGIMVGRTVRDIVGEPITVEFQTM